MSREVLSNVATQALAQYHPTDAAIAKMRDEYLPIRVEDVDDKPGAQRAHEARMVVRAHRVAIEKKRVELKADALAYGRAVDGEAKRLTALLEPLEAHLLAQEEIVTKEIERRKAAEQAARAEVLRARMVELSKVRSPLIAADVERMDDAAFNLALGVAQAEHADAEEAEREAAERRRLESERMAAERAELDRQRQEQEAERRRIESERAAIEKEKAEAQRQADIKAAEERAAAKALEDARLKAEQDEADRVRREAMRPVVEKLNALAATVATLEVPQSPCRVEVAQVLARAAQEIRAIAAR